MRFSFLLFKYDEENEYSKFQYNGVKNRLLLGVCFTLVFCFFLLFTCGNPFSAFPEIKSVDYNIGFSTTNPTIIYQIQCSNFASYQYQAVLKYRNEGSFRVSADQKLLKGPLRPETSCTFSNLNDGYYMAEFSIWENYNGKLFHITSLDTQTFFRIDRQPPAKPLLSRQSEANLTMSFTVDINHSEWPTSSEGTDVEIFYDLNGSTPNQNSLKLPSNQKFITINKDTRLRVAAIDQAGNRSEIAQADYFFQSFSLDSLSKSTFNIYKDNNAQFVINGTNLNSASYAWIQLGDISINVWFDTINWNAITARANFTVFRGTSCTFNIKDSFEHQFSLPITLVAATQPKINSVAPSSVKISDNTTVTVYGEEFFHITDIQLVCNGSASLLNSIVHSPQVLRLDINFLGASPGLCTIRIKDADSNTSAEQNITLGN